jgi:hypothetical protein
MFQASPPQSTPAAPAAPLTEADKLEAVLARTAAGDLQPAKLAVLSLSNCSAVAWDIKVLEGILTGVPGTMETADLQTIVDSRDPMKIVPASGMENLQIDQSWEVYRTLDCSHLRKLAKAELVRRQNVPGTAA